MVMDCSSPADPGGLSPPHGPVPALPTIYIIYKRKLVRLLAPPLILPQQLLRPPLPSPTHRRHGR